MKKFLSCLLVLCCFLLPSCGESASAYEEVTGHKIDSIERIETNNGYLQSWRGCINEEKFVFLDMEFKPTKKDIYSLTYSKHESEKSDMPYWVRGIVYVFTASGNFEFFVSADWYIYCYSSALQKSFVSKQRIDKSFFDGTGMVD